MNEEIFEEPWIFKPERFLNEKYEVEIPEHFIPFGLGEAFCSHQKGLISIIIFIGRRRCIGETLAKSNVFLFISNLLQTFNFENPEGCPLPDPFPVEGIIPSTQPYEALISRRRVC
jgi:methyl farnesoate epoxidase / farnesoate epoxidase